MFTNDEARKDVLMDSLVEEMLQDTAIEDDVVDEFEDSSDLVLQADFNEADLDEDVEVPTEVSEYISTLESQTKQLERELEKCDELLMYLPHKSPGNRQAVVLYEDSREMDEAAAEHGLSVEEFKQKILSDLELEDFTEEDVKCEFEEFSRLQEELSDLRSSIRFGASDDIKAILPLEYVTVEGGDNSLTSRETNLALCNGDVGTDADGSHANTRSLVPSRANNTLEAGPLVSSTTLSGMRDYVLKQLQETEQQHEIRIHTLTKSIEKCKQEEEAVLLLKEERRQMLQKVHDKEEAAMLERLQENDRLVEEEQKGKKEQTTMELNLIQTEIEQLSETLEREKQFYRISREKLVEKLDAARQQASVKIQKVYRGHRARKKHSDTIEALKEWRKLKKEEKYKLRIMEVEYEIKYREEKVQREKETQEKEAAIEKVKKEEEKKHEETERKKKEEEDRIFEELRLEKERKIKELRVLEERKREEEEKLRKDAELKLREEERLKKEEEKKRKIDEKKKQKEEEVRKKEEKRKIKEEEKRRKIEEKKFKEEEIKTKEEKKMFIENETFEREKEKETKEEVVKKTMKEKKNIEEEIIREETDGRGEEEMQGNNEIVPDKEREWNILEENMKNKPSIVDQAKEETFGKDVGKETNREFLTKLTNTQAAERKFDTQTAYKGDNLPSRDELFDSSLNAENSDFSSKDEKHEISCTDGKPVVSPKDKNTAKLSVQSTAGPQLSSSFFVSSKANLSPLHSEIFQLVKESTNTKSESTLAQPMSTSVTSSSSFQGTTGANLRSPPSESLVIHQQRLNWIKSCIPWSKISCEPWKLKQTAQKNYKRPAQAKRLPPVSEAVVLDKAHASSLREVTSVTLTSLPECSLSTLGQCWSLRYLTVTKCGLTCLEGLGQCKHLLYINAEDNKIEYMDLKDLGSLQVVRLARNCLSVIHGLDGCINLRLLDLSHNRITRISGLGSLRRVHTLNLSHNQLVGSDGLEEAVTLQHLDLSHNYLQQVKNISKLCLLSDLLLACNNLRQVPELENQVLLQTLYLQENSIKSLEPLSQYWLPLVHTLNCSQNMLESVSGISSLILLSHLDVGNNQITDLENLLPGITQNTRLETLVLEGNPLVDVHVNEYQQLVTRAVPSLKSLDHLTVEPQASESDIGSGARLCDDFIQMCLHQANQHTALKDEFNSQMRVLLVNQHVTAETLCSTCFTFCDTSFKLASEHRSAHEYGDASTINDIHHSPVFTMNGEKFHSVTNFRPPLESMADRKCLFQDAGNYTTPDKSVSNTDSIHNVCDKMVDSDAILDKDNYASNIQSTVFKNSNSVTVKSNISRETKDQHSKLTHANMQPGCDVSNNSTSITRQDQSQTTNMKLRLGATEANKTPKHSAEVEFSFPETTNSDSNNNYNNNMYHPSATGSPAEGISRFALAGKQSLENSIQDNNFTVKTKASSLKFDENGQFGQYLSGKDKFEMALQAQCSPGQVMTNVETQNNVNTHQSTTGSGRLLLSGVKANIVGGQLFNQDTSGISRDLELSVNDSDGNADLDNMEFDIDSFLDMGELDELLELGWRPADVPHIPHSMHPVLGKIKVTDGHSGNIHQQKLRGQDHMLPHPPNQPSQAWTNSPVSTEFKSAGLTSAVGAASSPVTAPSPFSVTSTAETASRGSIRSKKDELSEEWGFKDSRTVDMMLARAKKMKYNSERRRKLDQLDPQQKLHLLKKLEEKYRIKSTRSPSAKVLPRKEYFKAREEEFHRQELEKQTEDSTRFHRMFEWLHTQVGDYHASSSRLNPGVSSGYWNQDNNSSKHNFIGQTQARKSSPLSDHHKSVGREAQHIRRFSIEETPSGHSTILPPIHDSSLPSSHKKDRISYRDTPVEISGGWGGGKKRGKISR